jgi:diguanylate cyclase (GGDEF)-like protein
VMTGLANRSLFQATLSVIGAKNGGRGAVGALLLVDLDGFKQVNDTFGHALGDECLRQIALRLRDVCRTAILVARVGGDEFAVLMDDATGPDQARLLALAILQALSPPVLWGEYSFRIGASIGIAIPDASRQDNPSELFTQADIALYAAKAGGKNTFRIFDPQMKRDCDQRFEAVRNIARALSADELALFYQPKLRLDDGSHAGFEALLRWCKPCGEVVTAGAFQSAFDDPELSARIGRFVVEQAVQRAAHWHRQGLDFGHIAINLSTAQLLDPSFGDVLIARMAELGLAPHMIEVEVTENVFLDKEQGPVQRILERLKDSGVRVALDDFGTGHASLVHLRSYPIDIIKIDRSFVRHFLHSVQDRAILETILRLGASLGMDIVAEGIETVPQFETLRALGCKLGQGFLFSQAVPPDAAAALLKPIGFAPLRQAV